LEAVFDLASPLAPTGMYGVGWYWNSPYYAGVEYYDVKWEMYQIVNSTTPTPTPTPTATPTALPTIPAAPTPAPQPTVTPAPSPVAGAITTAAPSPATVKKGRTATLVYQVNEAVLGGKADVKITIKSKAGAVVKTLKVSDAEMNAQQSVSFTCKFKRGTYKFYVSASTAAGAVSTNTAWNTLTVK